MLKYISLLITAPVLLLALNIPIDGYEIVGNRFTRDVMSTEALTYDYIMDETLDGYPEKVRDLRTISRCHGCDGCRVS